MQSERPQSDRTMFPESLLAGKAKSVAPWMWAVGLVIVGIVLARIIQAALSGAGPIPESQLELHIVLLDHRASSSRLMI